MDIRLARDSFVLNTTALPRPLLAPVDTLTTPFYTPSTPHDWLDGQLKVAVNSHSLKLYPTLDFLQRDSPLPLCTVLPYFTPKLLLNPAPQLPKPTYWLKPTPAPPPKRSFSLLNFIHDNRRKRHCADAEILVALGDVQKIKLSKTFKKVLVHNTNPRIVRTLRYTSLARVSQEITSPTTSSNASSDTGLIYHVLNIYKTRESYEAVLRWGSSSGCATNGGTIKYPIGHGTALDQYVNHFKTMFAFGKTFISDTSAPKSV